VSIIYYQAVDRSKRYHASQLIDTDPYFSLTPIFAIFCSLRNAVISINYIADLRRGFYLSKQF